jgi:hypothetical protein
MSAQQAQAMTQHMANAGLARTSLASNHRYQLLHANPPSGIGMLAALRLFPY